MKTIAAYLLAVLGGNKNPDKNTLKKIIEAGGGVFNSERADALLAQLSGKNIDELLAQGKAKVCFCLVTFEISGYRFKNLRLLQWQRRKQLHLLQQQQLQLRRLLKRKRRKRRKKRKRN
jgi:hypothetical protein